MASSPACMWAGLRWQLLAGAAAKLRCWWLQHACKFSAYTTVLGQAASGTGGRRTAGPLTHYSISTSAGCRDARSCPPGAAQSAHLKCPSSSSRASNAITRTACVIRLHGRVKGLCCKEAREEQGRVIGRQRAFQVSGAASVFGICMCFVSFSRCRLMPEERAALPSACMRQACTVLVGGPSGHRTDCCEFWSCLIHAQPCILHVSACCEGSQAGARRARLHENMPTSQRGASAIPRTS